MSQLKAHAHPMIAQLANEMAHELYDTMMEDNLWYEMWKFQNTGITSAQALESRFVRKNIEKLLPQARATLAGMLATNIPEELKEQIHNALVMDKTLVAKRGTNAPQIIGRA